MTIEQNKLILVSLFGLMLITGAIGAFLVAFYCAMAIITIVVIDVVLNK